MNDIFIQKENFPNKIFKKSLFILVSYIYIYIYIYLFIFSYMSSKECFTFIVHRFVWIINEIITYLKKKNGKKCCFIYMYKGTGECQKLPFFQLGIPPPFLRGF